MATLRDALFDVPHLAAAGAERDGMPDALARKHGGCRVAPLYAENGARIHRFLCDLLGDRALAADATQETFVRAHRNIDRLDEGARVVPWLFGIARNVSLELRKARFRNARHVVMGVDADAPAPGSPESELLGREALRIVDTALKTLSEERRAMLVLRLDHGLSYDEIAETMGCSLAKAKVEVHRAREILRGVMARYESGSGGAR